MLTFYALISKQGLTKLKLKNLVCTVKTHKGFSKQKGSVARILTTFFLLKNSLKFHLSTKYSKSCPSLTYLPTIYQVIGRSTHLQRLLYGHFGSCTSKKI